MKQFGAVALAAVFALVRGKGGSFQFLADVETPEKTLTLDSMGAIMEAARIHDEGTRDDELDSLDFEAAMARKLLRELTVLIVSQSAED